MIKIAICEDIDVQQELLKEYIDKIFSDLSYKYELYIFDSGEELFKTYPKSIDIFLLDIHMDKMNGMDVARKIREIGDKKSEIIFITSLIEYIQEGYEVRAYRYLLKPLKFEEIKKHITSCVQEINENRENYIIISDKYATYKINIMDITYIEIQKKDMIIHTINKNYEVKSSMYTIEKELTDYNFFRCHRSFLVNIKFVNKVKQYIVILDNNEEIPVSRYKLKELKSRVCSYIGDIL